MADIEIKDMSDRDLLVQLVTVVNKMNESWDKIAEEPGFPRCQVRAEKLKFLEGRLKWLNRTAIGALVMVLLGLIADWFKH